MYKQYSNEIQTVISDYFQAIYNGEIDTLKEVFHSEALLFGDINGSSYFNTLTDYIEGVKNRKSPNELGETFAMKTISIEILERTAIVRLHVPMLGYNYYDLLSLTIINGKWKIVNKLFTHVE